MDIRNWVIIKSHELGIDFAEKSILNINPKIILIAAEKNEFAVGAYGLEREEIQEILLCLLGSLISDECATEVLDPNETIVAPAGRMLS